MGVGRSHGKICVRREEFKTTEVVGPDSWVGRRHEMGPSSRSCVGIDDTQSHPAPLLCCTMRRLAPTSTDFAVLLALLAGCVLLGCDRWGSSPGIDEDIETFVDTEPLPDAQRPRLLWRGPGLDVQVFAVSFGEARDCPSGCFYSTAYGLALQDRIGWMGLDAYGRDDSVRTAVTRFDVRSRDSTLFGEQIRRHFRRAEQRSDRNTAETAYEVFLEMVATDEDTPHTALLDLARLLHDEFHPWTGRALLSNPTVRTSRLILEELARLPDRGHYEDISDQAQPRRRRPKELGQAGTWEERSVTGRTEWQESSGGLLFTV